MHRFLLSFLLLPLFSFAQINKEYQGLLWKISGNGLEDPSFLYGTMHVSNRVAFHLSETFFEALDNADYVALETNPETWVSDLTSSELYRDLFKMSYQYNQYMMPLYSSFNPKEPQQQEWEYYLARDQDLLNNLLYRLDQQDQDFAENTYLDLFIFQAGRKAGKTIYALEDYEESYKSVLKASRQDEDAVYITDRQARDLLGDFTDWQTLMEDAYRRGDLDLIDTLNSVLYPGKYYRKNMLDDRNQIMVSGMDSLMQAGVLFTGVGASHLPGKMGVINLLREKGYTVEAEDRAVTTTSISRKDEIDEIVLNAELQDFISDDYFIQAQVPGKMIKFLSQPYQEYVFADMVNGGFYSIRRIPTYGPVYGKDRAFYQGRIDSMLFENIPGKILSKDTIQVSGFPAFDIKNETRTGDHQHYQIVFTDLEVIIFKVGGHKKFAESALPEAFFKSLELNSFDDTEKYRPQFEGFELRMPGNLRTEQYEAAFANPYYTFWVQSYDDGAYYAAALRQYHDFDYFEEDDFELKYLIEKIADDKKLEVDTIYLAERERTTFSRFVLKNKKDEKIFGQVHLQGPKYLMLMTTAQDQAEQESFFNSFAFTAWHYEDEFQEYQDSVLHVRMESPMKLNDYDSFLEGLGQSRGYQSDEDHRYRGELKEKVLSYSPSGEQIKVRLETEHIYASYPKLEDYWLEKISDFSEEEDLLLISDSTLYTKQDDNYLSEAKLLVFSDTNTHRQIKTKWILENGALYSLWTLSDSLGYRSAFAERALASFQPAGDTIFGKPITLPKSDLFFEALDSRDSVRLFEASNSVYEVDFVESDAARIKDYVLNYEQEGFDRTARLKLLNRLSWLDNEKHIPFLEDLYYDKLDSSAYQFKILETLVDFNGKEGNKSFKKLIMDEPPFTATSYIYSQLFNEFRDTIELAPIIYPDILPLTDFEDYRSEIYELLAELLDSGLVKGSDYKSKYKSLLLFAKVELKKQHASDESTNSYSRKKTVNQDLVTYTKLLRPFARKKEVQEQYQKTLSVRNEAVLADLVVVMDPHWEVPDSTWNSLAKKPKAFYKVYPYLRKNNKLKVLDEKYRSREYYAQSILEYSRYASYDTISFIRSAKVDIKPYPAEVFFFRARDEDEKLWRLLYLVVEDKERLSSDYVLTQEGETYNEDIADMDEVIKDALKDIKLYGRERVVD